METRPIDADALRQKIEKCALDADRASSFSNPDGGAFYDEVLDAIDATPTIDPNIQCPVTH